MCHCELICMSRGFIFGGQTFPRRSITARFTFDRSFAVSSLGDPSKPRCHFGFIETTNVSLVPVVETDITLSSSLSVSCAHEAEGAAKTGGRDNARQSVGKEK